MWSMVLAIHVNGEFLRRNSAARDRYIPLTRYNYIDYYDLIIFSLFKSLIHLIKVENNNENSIVSIYLVY